MKIIKTNFKDLLIVKQKIILIKEAVLEKFIIRNF